MSWEPYLLRLEVTAEFRRLAPHPWMNMRAHHLSAVGMRPAQSTAAPKVEKLSEEVVHPSSPIGGVARVNEDKRCEAASNGGVIRCRKEAQPGSLVCCVHARGLYEKFTYTDKGGKDPKLCERGGCNNLHARNGKLCEGHLAMEMQMLGTRVTTVGELKKKIASAPDEMLVNFWPDGDPRERLSDERDGAIQKFRILSPGKNPGELRETKGYLQSGVYEDGRLGEIFISIDKAGHAAKTLEQWAMAISVILQLGVDVDTICQKFLHQRFGPGGRVVGIDGIRICSSTTDLAAQWMVLRYGSEKGREVIKQRNTMVEEVPLDPSR